MKFLFVFFEIFEIFIYFIESLLQLRSKPVAILCVVSPAWEAPTSCLM